MDKKIIMDIVEENEECIICYKLEYYVKLCCSCNYKYCINCAKKLNYNCAICFRQHKKIYDYDSIPLHITCICSHIIGVLLVVIFVFFSYILFLFIVYSLLNNNIIF